MVYESYETQKRSKREHRERIISLLSEETRSFTEMQKSTGFSPAGLSKMLKDLVSEGIIEKAGTSNKSPYKIRGKGTGAKEFLFPGDKISDLREGGKYYFDLPDHHLSQIFDFNPLFGIDSHLLLDRKLYKKHKPFWKKEVLEIERRAYDLLKEKSRREKLIGDKLLKDSKVNKKFFLILEFDYEQIVDIIENRSDDENEALIKKKLREIRNNP